MAEAVYLLCALTSVACFALLLRGYLRSRVRLLLFSALCFAGFAANNVLLLIDAVVLPAADLSLWRNLTALLGVVALLYGLITDAG
jgi:hypothetical protein